MTMNNLVFSIIVPVYNASETLAKCVDSIISQTNSCYEIIFVDGQSTDDTMKIIENYSTINESIQSVSEKDNGIYDAMNKGIIMARGEWIYFMGADDSLNSNNVLSVVAEHAKGGADIVYGNSTWVPENIMEAGEWGYYELLNRSINHQRVFYRRYLFEKLGSFNLVYPIASDYELNIRFFCEPGMNKKYINHTIANYHSGGFSSSKVDGVFWNNWKKILLKNFAPYLPTKDIYNRISWYCWYMLQQKQYAKAGKLFFQIYFSTFSIGFVKHTLSQLLKQLRSKP